YYRLLIESTSDVIYYSLLLFPEGCCRLVDPSRWLYHAASRLLSGVLQAIQLVTLTLSCRQSPAVKGAADWS
ncbi:hypothetical protein GW17_00060718, partial [Ensete ventricosum]